MSTAGFTIGIHESWAAFAELFVRYPRPFARMKLTADETAIIVQMLSHKPGYRVTVEYLRENIEGLSRDKCYAAIKRLAERGILDRERAKDDKGVFTGMQYTLMPPPEFRVLADAMQAAEAASRSSGPLPENQEVDKPLVSTPLPGYQEVDTTCENTPEIEQNPRSSPLPDHPDLDDPDMGDTTQRESKKKEIKEEKKKDLSLQADAQDVTPEPERETEDAGGNPQPPAEEEPHGGHTLAARNILNATIPRPVGAKFSESQREHVISLVAALLSAGWSGTVLRARLDGKVTEAAYDPYAILRNHLKGMGAEAPQGATAIQGDLWSTGEGQEAPQGLGEATPGVRLLSNGNRQILYSSCGGRSCTGGSGAGNGSGNYRRRINQDTGFATEYCDNPVTMSDGTVTTCHPDARRKQDASA